MCYRVCVGKHMKEREDAGRFMQHQGSCKHLQCEKMKNRLTPNMKHNRKDAPKLPCNQNANTQKQREKAWHCFVCVMSCLRLRGCHGQVLNIKKPRGNWSCGSETLIWSCTWRRARQESCGSESVSQLLDHP